MEGFAVQYEDFERLFPFSFVMDHSGQIVRMGPSLRKMIVPTSMPIPVTDYFEISRPTGQAFDTSILGLVGEMIQLSSLPLCANFMGQILPLEDQYILFVMNLKVQDAKELAALNLTFNDFAIQDQVFDFLMLLNMHRQATQHAEALNLQMHEANRTAIRASQLKSQFLANMSHELRTPMNGVIGMASILMETDLTEEQKEYVDSLVTSGEAMLTLINDILDLSKIEAGHIELESTQFKFKDLTDEVFQIMRAAAEKKSLNLDLVVDPTLPEKMKGDSTRLRQVIINLIANAIKFTEHGKVTLEVSHVATFDQKVSLHFRVSDTGIGMNAETLARIFQPFVQGDASTTRRYGGTGLGLSISQRIVEQMGGKIRVTSEVGKGSCFSFDAHFLCAEDGGSV